MPVARILFASVAALVMSPAAIAAEPPAGGAGPAAEPLKDCRTDLKYLNSVAGWQILWPRQLRRIDSLAPNQTADFFATWNQAPGVLRTEIGLLRTGMSTGSAAPRSTVERVIRQVESFETELESGGLAEGKWASHPQRKAIVAALLPAVRNYRAFLRDEYLPRASAGDGLPHTPAGERCFERAVEWWTGLAIKPAAVERIGSRILAETDRDLLRSARAPSSRKRQLLDRLRKGPADQQVGGDDILGISRSAIDRAQSHLDGWFVDIPAIPVRVAAMAPSIAANAPAGAYSPASVTGREPVYEVNTSRPNDRRLMAEVIAFHEGVPGHHLAAIASRSSKGFSAGFGEGWAIYAEYLADEMGLYSARQDRVGMMAKHLWAASRLIVEPGLHVHGWSRARAIEFMLANTALSRKEIEIEVDRYISMPGQSLSYMLGYDRFRTMRARAEHALGKRFSLPQFHKLILQDGMRDLDAVDEEVTRWIASRAAGGESTAPAVGRPPSGTPFVPRGPGEAPDFGRTKRTALG